MECRSPSPPLHFPDIRSTPSPLRRRLPRPLPEPPGRLPKVGTWASSPSSSVASSRSCSACSDGSESVLAIIHEIDDALYYTNSTSSRRQQKSPRFSAVPDYYRPAPPTVFPLSPPRQRRGSTASSASISSSSSSSYSSSSPPTPGRMLRRQFSPRNESLREIRARDSEICLQRVYEREVMMYLDGSIFSVRPFQDGWGTP
ncbi:uncharacterized protein LTHEOB_12660 [Lasiodiplodia theobromae]|uniref:Uncharacterized protein n=1 Tax=Lasiodiplodia theobromae TaxID=45133 RepID=A0A5N5D422_9PEZI|nr:uncharacterized protein LTHEOB_12660 [Lasiodiplodia theobromae]KAB2572453.1 hypothetical protein DBV05_g8908 [Lasiodiplodia theobromae]KAF4535714.1 hypothetical protein LTHEOB_12660 [Lasiodiplodia theobromae]